MLSVPRAVAPRRTAVVLGRASEVLGRDVGSIDARFDDNRAVQVAVFLANHLHRALLLEAGVESVASSGLSLGEYNHLVDIGALSFEDALRLVDERGRLYDEGPRGAMAAIFPAPTDEVEALVEEVGGDLWISNYNCPTQHVIAGETAAVERASALAEDELFAQARIIERRIPMHTPRFKPVADRLREVLIRMPWRPARRAYWSNVSAESIERPSPGELVASMTRHVRSPVRWHAQLLALAKRHPGATPIEVGPGTVLRDLATRSGVEVRDTCSVEAIAAFAGSKPSGGLDVRV